MEGDEPHFFFFFLGVGASYSTRSYRQGYKRKPPDKGQRTKDRGLRTKRQENKRETKRKQTERNEVSLRIVVFKGQGRVFYLIKEHVKNFMKLSF